MANGYVETDLLKMAIEAEPFFTESTKAAFRNIVNKVLTIDPESLRPTGEWDDSGRYRFPGGAIAVRCTECGCALTISEYRLQNWNYCPVCGAKMKGADPCTN